MPPVEMEWPQRLTAAASTGAETGNLPVTWMDLVRTVADGRFAPWFERFLFGSLAEHLADRFGTKGSPIATSTACASGATAIQLGVEAIRRGEAEAALVDRHRRLGEPGEPDPLLPALRPVHSQRPAGGCRPPVLP